MTTGPVSVNLPSAILPSFDTSMRTWIPVGTGAAASAATAPCELVAAPDGPALSRSPASATPVMSPRRRVI